MSSRASAFTLLETLVSIAILAIALTLLASGFRVIVERCESTSALGDLRSQGAFALEAIARELRESGPGLVDTIQRGPGRATSDVFEDPLGSNCGSPVCPSLSATGAASLPTEPGRFLGLTSSNLAVGVAWSPAQARGNLCPLDGSALSAPAFTDALLFLVPRDLDDASQPPRLVNGGTAPVWSSIVVVAPWIDPAGRGSLRRYGLPWRAVLERASSTPASSGTLLAASLDPDGDSVLFRATSPQTYDLGGAGDNVFALETVGGRPSIVWQKGALSGEHVRIVFDRATGTATWDVRRTFPDGTLASVESAGAPRPTRTWASGQGYGCVDFAVSTFDSDAFAPSDPSKLVADPTRVRLTVALAATRASARRTGRETQVVVSSLDVHLENRP